MQMGKVFAVMRHDNEPALLTLNYQHRIDYLYVDNDCMTYSMGNTFDLICIGSCAI